MRKSNLFYVIGTAGSGFISIITIPLLTWFFSVQDIGISALYIVIVNLLTVISSLALEQYILRNYYSLNELEKSRMFSSFYLLTVIFLTLIGLILAIFYSEISEWIFLESNIVAIAVIFVTSLATLSKKFTSITLRMESESLYFAIGQVSEKFIFLALVIALGILEEEKLSWMQFIFTYMTSSVLSSIFQSYICVSKGYIRIKLRNLNVDLVKKSISYSMPLLFSIIIIWGMGSLDKLMLNNFSGAYELGLYSNAFKFAGVGILMQGLVCTILLPTLQRQYKNNVSLDVYQNILNIVVYGCVAVYAIALLLLPLLKYVLSEEFHQSIDLVPILLMYPMFFMISEVSGIGVIFSKKTRFSFYSSVITLSVIVIMLYYLVPNLGAKGAAFSVSISYFIMFLSRSIFSSICWVNIFTPSSYVGVLLLFLLFFINRIETVYIMLSIMSTLYLLRKVRDMRTI